MGERAVEERLVTGEGVEGHNLTVAGVAVGAACVIHGDARQGGEHFLFDAAVGADEFVQDVAGEVEAGRGAQMRACFGQKLGGGKAVGGLIEGDDVVQRIVAVAVLFALKFDGVGIVGDAGKDPAAAGHGLHVVEKFDGLLALDGGDERGNGGCGGNLALFHLLSRQEVAASTGFQEFEVGLAHGAFVTRAGGAEDAGGALNVLNGTVDPGGIELKAGAVDGEARFAVVQTGDDQIGPAEGTQAQVVNNVAGEGLGEDIGVDIFGAAGGDVGFVLAVIRGTVENGAAEVGVFNAVHVGDEETANAEEGEIFDDFIAEGAGTNDKDAGVGEFLLIPPVDEAQAGEAIVGGGDVEGGVHGQGSKRDGGSRTGHHTCRPAVISGRRRMMSPSWTWALARVWVSRSCRPEER